VEHEHCVFNALRMARFLHTRGEHTTYGEDAQEHDDQKQERKMSAASSLVIQPNPYPESADKYRSRSC